MKDSGGTETDPDAFGLRVDDGSVLDGFPNAYDVGTHIVSADGLDGFFGARLVRAVK